MCVARASAVRAARGFWVGFRAAAITAGVPEPIAAIASSSDFACVQSMDQNPLPAGQRVRPVAHARYRDGRRVRLESPMRFRTRALLSSDRGHYGHGAIAGATLLETESVRDHPGSHILGEPIREVVITPRCPVRLGAVTAAAVAIR